MKTEGEEKEEQVEQWQTWECLNTLEDGSWEMKGMVWHGTNMFEMIQHKPKMNNA